MSPSLRRSPPSLALAALFTFAGALGCDATAQVEHLAGWAGAAPPFQCRQKPIVAERADLAPPVLVPPAPPAASFATYATLAQRPVIEDGAVVRCSGGACSHAVDIACPEPAACQEAGPYDPIDAACTYVRRPDGAPCNDGDPRTVEDRCAKSVCRGTPARVR